MIKLAIDFGTATTKIYKLGYGIVLTEATCVTSQKDTGEVRAYGNEAKRLLGKTADLTDVSFPVWEGEIVSEKRAAAVLEYFVQKVAKRGAEALFCVPTGRPRSVSVASEDILFPVRTYIDKIIEYAELVLRKLPAEVSAAMCKNGVYFSGGVCALEGFAEYMEEKLQMEVHVAQDPETAVVSGGGRVLGNNALLDRIMME